MTNLQTKYLKRDTEQTISGKKFFEKDSLNVKDDEAKITFLDGQNSETGFIKAGNSELSLGLDVDNSVKITKNQNNVVITCPNPDSNASNNEIATAFFVNSKIEESNLSIQKKITDIESKHAEFESLVKQGNDGEVLEISNQNITFNPIFEFARICDTQKDVDDAKSKLINAEGIYYSWIKFTHDNSGQNLNNDAHNNSKWGIVNLGEGVGTSFNSACYMGLVSRRKYQNWSLSTRMTGLDSDNDIVGIIVGFMTDSEGVQHTISLLRSVKAESHTKYLFVLVYDYLLTTEKVIVNNPCSEIVGLDVGWSGYYCNLKVEKSGSSLKCYSSLISQDKNAEAKYLLSYSLPASKPSSWDDEMWNNVSYMLSNPVQVGLGCFSQKCEIIITDQLNLVDPKIYDTFNDIIWTYQFSTKTWLKSGKAFDYLKENHLYYNQQESQLFFIQDKIAHNIRR